VTGGSSPSDGTLDLLVDPGSGPGGGYGTVATGTWSLSSSVFSGCFAAPLLGVRVTNPTDNAWVGSVKYSSDGGTTYSALECESCGGSTTGTGYIVVDGNSDGSSLSTTQCLDGATCSIGVPTLSPTASPTAAPWTTNLASCAAALGAAADVSSRLACTQACEDRPPHLFPTLFWRPREGSTREQDWAADLVSTNEALKSVGEYVEALVEGGEVGLMPYLASGKVAAEKLQLLEGELRSAIERSPCTGDNCQESGSGEYGSGSGEYGSGQQANCTSCFCGGFERDCWVAKGGGCCADGMYTCMDATEPVSAGSRSLELADVGPDVLPPAPLGDSGVALGCVEAGSDHALGCFLLDADSSWPATIDASERVAVSTNETGAVVGVRLASSLGLSASAALVCYVERHSNAMVCRGVSISSGEISVASRSVMADDYSANYTAALAARMGDNAAIGCGGLRDSCSKLNASGHLAMLTYTDADGQLVSSPDGFQLTASGAQVVSTAGTPLENDVLTCYRVAQPTGDRFDG
jgi:hypothetical protein